MVFVENKIKCRRNTGFKGMQSGKFLVSM